MLFRQRSVGYSYLSHSVYHQKVPERIDGVAFSGADSVTLVRFWSAHRRMSWGVGQNNFFRAIEQFFGQRSENLVHV